MEKVKIFDTTLRDGEQSPGFTMNREEKTTMANQLTRLGVDVIEAGFAAASPGDFESVRDIGHSIEGPMIVSLCRTIHSDIDASVEALKGSANWGIHTFTASSPLHMKYKLKKEPAEVIKAAVSAVEHARKFTDNIEFSAEDATRSDIPFLVKLFSETIAAGATTINVPDTVGYTVPTEMRALIERLMNEVKDIDKVIVSVHCHNDLGLAVANSMAAVQAGARQIECTINGIGERAGNASLEELVMIMRTRPQIFGVDTNIDSEQIYRSSRLLTQITGMSVQANKAVVGKNAFAHEAGIHQDGMLKNPLTYEIMTPQSVGIKENQMVLGKHSGRNALQTRIKELGFTVGAENIDRIFNDFKRLCDLKKVVYDEDIEALVSHGHTEQALQHYRLERLNIHSGTDVKPHAKIEMMVNGELIKIEEDGDGPVDAAFKAIKSATGSTCTLVSYKIDAITKGTDAQGRVSVSIDEGGQHVSGHGADPDIVLASAKAFILALNRAHTKVAQAGVA